MTSCQQHLHYIIILRGPITLKSLYYKASKFSKSSVRRSLYELRDQKKIYKNKDNKWETNKWQIIQSVDTVVMTNILEILVDIVIICITPNVVKFVIGCKLEFGEWLE